MKPGHAFLTIALLSLSALSAWAGHVTLIRTPEHGIQPQAVMDSRGVVHLIYYRGDPAGGNIFYVQRPPGQAGFSKPLRVNSQTNSAIAIGNIRGAQLAVGRNGRVHVAWNGRAPAKGSYLEAPMLYTRLNDTGTAFEPERNVITFARGLDGGGSVAADNQGNVYVFWHAPKPGNTNGEAGRALFVAHSVDEGKTFAPETLATTKPTGACACCGMKAFAGSHGNLFALFRGATDQGYRDEILLLSHNHKTDFKVIDEQPWKLSSCPMSSAFISEFSRGVLAAGETQYHVFFVRVDSVTGKVTPPVSPRTKGKYPVAIGNNRGEVLLAWTEDTAWAKGGAVAWQVYGSDDKPGAETGRAEGVPAWSLITAYADPAGDFVIVY